MFGTSGGAVIPHKAAAVVLRRAADKVGGLEQLARALGIRPNVLMHYVEGREPVPEEVYLRAVDIVLGDPDNPPPPGSASAKERC